ncbi:hypothetical protein PPL_12501 [Heterostelium album PN500]|uniref:Ankyrin repeat protein n=1 Tax=Heterostelium pallidum (strain ATCC 26659 / Pp 5 / PN500) TaxID=670386 RepID=D3BMS8_HETP5|nr:hypothetical protein PPL_12501 [Heterostelium album PN500]EFA77290.1 hypothetical protein PPL_12501 [Heterostelium album PN500]|eukprot:XP_020429419.1 hypothetical protein PPL_12501 [Heterostelium album PN500]
MFMIMMLNKLIFKYVVDISSINGRLHYKWDRVTILPEVLAAHGYIDQLKSISAIEPNLSITIAIQCKLKEHSDQPRSEIDGNVFNEVAYYGDIGIIKWLAENRSEDLASSDMFYSGFAANHQHILEYVLFLHNNLFDQSKPQYISSTIKYPNRFTLFKFIYGVGCVCPDNVMDLAAMSSNFDAMKWLHSNTTHRSTSKSLNFAAQANRFYIITWLKESCNLNYTVEMMDTAVGAGHIELVKWLNVNSTEGCSVAAMNIAAINSNLEMVNWLKENRTEGHSHGQILDVVASAGDVAML